MASLIRYKTRWAVIIGAAQVALCLAGCKFAAAPKAPRRAGAHDSVIIPESVTFERSLDRLSINLNFEARVAANCKFGFFPTSSEKKSVSTYTPCVGRSATKFNETVSGLPKDQMVTIVIMSWSAKDDEKTAKGLLITESPPNADRDTINVFSVDLGGGRLELSAIAGSDSPSASLSTALSKVQSPSCNLNNVAPAYMASRKSNQVLSVTSRGFINAGATVISNSAVAGSFAIVQRQSTEWSITARTANGYGQIRFAKPTLLKSATFAGRDQAPADDDFLEDVDPPSLKLTASQTFVASWVLDGDPKNSMITLSIAPSGGFKGVTCTAPASLGKITIPTALVSQLPQNERLWVSMRLDSWQAFDDARWLARVSDWKSLGAQRL
jgi:hypothetical protein